MVAAQLGALSIKPQRNRSAVEAHGGNKFKPSLAAVGSQADRRAAFQTYSIKAGLPDTTQLQTLLLGLIIFAERNLDGLRYT